MYVLDTDILSLIHAGDETVVERLRGAQMPVATTIVTKAEILQARFAYLLKAENAEHVMRAQEWLGKSLAVLATYVVIQFDEAAANTFDTLRRQKGIGRMGRADMLIACIALANRATLVTANVKDFERVPQLKIVDWTK